MLPASNITYMDPIILGKYQTTYPNKKLNQQLGFCVEHLDKQLMLSAGINIAYEHLQSYAPYDYEIRMPKPALDIIVDVKCAFYGSRSHTISDGEIDAYRYELDRVDGFKVLIRSYSQTNPDDINNYHFNGTYLLNSLWQAGRINPSRISSGWYVNLSDLPGHEFDI